MASVSYRAARLRCLVQKIWSILKYVICGVDLVSVLTSANASLSRGHQASATSHEVKEPTFGRTLHLAVGLQGS